MIRIGCCGFPVAKQRYFKSFNVVELQQTFYQPPEIKTIKKWHEEMPNDFEYTLKAWQLITHEPGSPTYRRLKKRLPESKKKNYGAFKPTDEVFTAWERTREIADSLDAKIVVFQSPPSFEPTKENRKNMKIFLNSIKSDKYIFVWEPRGKWNDKEIRVICQELNLVHCVDPFKSKPTYEGLRYYRLHGISSYRYKYTIEDLLTLKEFLRENIDSYFMFNNIYMYEDAAAFKKIVCPDS